MRGLCAVGGPTARPGILDLPPLVLSGMKQSMLGAVALISTRPNTPTPAHGPEFDPESTVSRLVRNRRSRKHVEKA